MLVEAIEPKGNEKTGNLTTIDEDVLVPPCDETTERNLSLKRKSGVTMKRGLHRQSPPKNLDMNITGHSEPRMTRPIKKAGLRRHHAPHSAAGRAVQQRHGATTPRRTRRRTREDIEAKARIFSSGGSSILRQHPQEAEVGAFCSQTSAPHASMEEGLQQDQHPEDSFEVVPHLAEAILVEEDIGSTQQEQLEVVIAQKLTNDTKRWFWLVACILLTVIVSAIAIAVVASRPAGILPNLDQTTGVGGMSTFVPTTAAVASNAMPTSMPTSAPSSTPPGTLVAELCLLDPANPFFGRDLCPPSLACTQCPGSLDGEQQSQPPELCFAPGLDKSFLQSHCDQIKNVGTRPCGALSNCPAENHCVYCASYGTDLAGNLCMDEDVDIDDFSVTYQECVFLNTDPGQLLPVVLEIQLPDTSPSTVAWEVVCEEEEDEEERLIRSVEAGRYSTSGELVKEEVQVPFDRNCTLRIDDAGGGVMDSWGVGLQNMWLKHAPYGWINWDRIDGIVSGQKIPFILKVTKPHAY